MNYTHKTDEMVFIKDRDIILDLSAKNADGIEVTTNGIASFKLVDELYDEIVTSAYNLCDEISSLEKYVNDTSAELSNTVDEQYVHMSGDANIGSLNISGTVDIDNDLSVSTKVMTPLVNSPMVEFKDSADLDEVHIKVSNGVTSTEFSLPEESGKLITTETVSALSDFLSAEISSNDSDIFDLSSDLSIHLIEGMLYKGDLTIVDPTKTYSTLSDYFHDNVTGDHAYEFKLGDMYRFSLSVETGDGLYFGENDYIIFNKNVILEKLTSADINIIRDANIEATKLCSDFTAFKASTETSANNICVAISCNDEDISDLYLSVGELCGQIIANDGDIAEIQTSVDNLCTEISSLEESLCATIDENYVHVSGDIMTGKLDVQNQIVATESISSKTSVYATEEFQVGDLIDDPTVSAPGKKIEITSSKVVVSEKARGGAISSAEYEFPGESGTFALESYVNGISTSLCSTVSADVDYLSGEISNHVEEVAISAENLCSEISTSNENIRKIHGNLNTLSGRYDNTFCTEDKDNNSHISSDNLILTDLCVHISGGTTHRQYYLSFENGTLVLVPLT